MRSRSHVECARRRTGLKTESLGYADAALKRLLRNLSRPLTRTRFVPLRHPGTAVPGFPVPPPSGLGRMVVRDRGILRILEIQGVDFPGTDIALEAEGS